LEALQEEIDSLKREMVAKDQQLELLEGENAASQVQAQAAETAQQKTKAENQKLTTCVEQLQGAILNKERRLETVEREAQESHALMVQ
jgi:hypothetical protein